MDGRWWLWVGSQVLSSMGQRRPCFGVVFSDMAPEELQRYRWCFHVSSFLCHLCLRGSGGKQVSGSHSIYLSVQAACAMCCPDGDLKLLVPQGPGHLRSETIGPSLVPSLGPVSSLCFLSLTLPKTSLSLSLSMVPSAVLWTLVQCWESWEKHGCGL